MAVKNPCGKTVKRENAYEIWQTLDGTWTWYVLKKWQIDDDKPRARWFCDVVTPICPNGELGDVYVADIKAQAVRVDNVRIWNTDNLVEEIKAFDSHGQEADENQRYNIVRFHFGGTKEIIETDVSLEEAQAHCNRDDTSGEGWFDGYWRR